MTCFYKLWEPGEWSEECEMSQILFITKWADQELFPIARSTVIAVCCLTVNRAGKWQWLDVVAQSQLSYTTPQYPLHTSLLAERQCSYVWPTLVAITQIKNVLTTELKGLLSTVNSRLGCRHIIPQSPRKVFNWAKETKWSVPDIAVVKLNAVMRHGDGGFWLARTHVGLVW